MREGTRYRSPVQQRTDVRDPDVYETKDTPNDQSIAQEAPSAGVTNAHPFAAKAPADSLFVLRSSDWRP